MMRRALLVMMGVALLGMSRPGVEEQVERVRTLAATIVDATRSSAERDRALEESIRARGELISIGAGDDRLATWLLDQAEAVLQRAGADGAALSVVYGLPTPAQRARVREAAAEAVALVGRAQEAAEGTVERLEASLFAARGDAAKAAEVSARIEPRMTVLVDRELAWRAPMLRARGAVLVAATMEGAGADGERRRLALAAEEEVEGIRGPTQATESARAVVMGAALLIAGERERAKGTFDLAVGEPGVTGEEAALGAALAGGVREELEGLAGGEAPVLRLLRAEAAARGMLAGLPEKGDERIAGQRRAFAGLGGVVGMCLVGDMGDAFEALVFEKVAVATEKDAPGGPIDVAQMGEMIRLGRGVWLFGHASSPAVWEEGRALLRALASAEGTQGWRVRALRELGEGLTRRVLESDAGSPGDAEEAMGWLVEVMKITPARAAAVLGDGVRLINWAARARLSGDERARFVAAERRLIEQAALVKPAPEGMDALRAEYARTYAAAKGEAITRDTLGRVLEICTPRVKDGGVMNGLVEIIADRAMDTLSGAEREDAARLVVDWGTARGAAFAARFRVPLAQAAMERGDARACLVELRAIGALDGPALRESERVRARLLMGRAQRATGDADGAFATLRTLADELDHDPVSGAEPKRPEAFWAAWAEMLEILATQNADGARTASMRLQINRLALIDAAFGGGAPGTRIGVVRDSLK